MFSYLKTRWTKFPAVKVKEEIWYFSGASSYHSRVESGTWLRESHKRRLVGLVDPVHVVLFRGGSETLRGLGSPARK